MRYDSWPDYKYFIMGAALVSSKVFWTGEGDSNKAVKEDINVILSRDKKVVRLNNYKK